MEIRIQEQVTLASGNGGTNIIGDYIYLRFDTNAQTLRYLTCGTPTLTSSQIDVHTQTFDGRILTLDTTLTFVSVTANYSNMSSLICNIEVPSQAGSCSCDNPSTTVTWSSYPDGTFSCPNGNFIPIGTSVNNVPTTSDCRPLSMLILPMLAALCLLLTVTLWQTQHQLRRYKQQVNLSSQPLARQSKLTHRQTT
jgi:hypothetical protein